MDIQNVFVLIGKGWNKDRVQKDLVGENYKHNFYFSEGQGWDKQIKALNISNECWTFGDCDGLEMFKYVERNSIDCWRMG